MLTLEIILHFKNLPDRMEAILEILVESLIKITVQSKKLRRSKSSEDNKEQESIDSLLATKVSDAPRESFDTPAPKPSVSKLEKSSQSKLQKPSDEVVKMLESKQKLEETGLNDYEKTDFDERDSHDPSALGIATEKNVLKKMSEHVTLKDASSELELLKKEGLGTISASLLHYDSKCANRIKFYLCENEGS